MDIEIRHKKEFKVLSVSAWFFSANLLFHNPYKYLYGFELAMKIWKSEKN